MDDKKKQPTLTVKGKTTIAVLILGVGFMIFYAMMVLGPRPEKLPQRIAAQDVEVRTVRRGSVPLTVVSQGIVEAATETRSTAEVGGRVVLVAPKFNAGETFAEGDELIRLDDADYRAAVAAAEASLRDAELQMKLEEAKAAQALRDWEKLAAGKPETGLVTREPHLAAAKARTKSAGEALTKAQRDLDRTVLKAPYRGRIRRTHTDIGSVVAPGSPLADFYATDIFEVRLPVQIDDLAALDLNSQPAVVLRAETAGTVHEFTGTIVRTEGEVDRSSRSVYLVAAIRPGEKPDPLLMPGLFLRAEIRGRTLENVMRLPRLALYGENRVITVSPDNKLGFRDVKIVRAERDSILINEGLTEGERVLATVLPVVVEGAVVHPLEETATGTSAEPKNAPASQVTPPVTG